jgi:hypothetical protein
MRFGFLIYMARSGSTLFARHLDAVSPDLLVTPEWNAPLLALRRGDAWLRARDANSLSRFLALDRQIDNLELSNETLTEIAAACAGRGARALVEALVTAHARQRRRAPEAVVIKNSGALWLADELIARFPEARFVHVERDGRAVVSSLIHTESSYDPGRPMGRGDPLYCARLWTEYLDAFDRLAARHPERVIRVRYEEFLAAPESVAARVREELAAGLGVTLRPGTAGAGRFQVPERERLLHALVEKPPDAARAAGWQRELTRTEGIAVEWLEREHLAARGYAAHFLANASESEVAQARKTEQRRHLRTSANHYARRAVTLLKLLVRDRPRALAALRDALFERFAR